MRIQGIGERPIFQPLNLVNEQCEQILNNELNRTWENFGEGLGDMSANNQLQMNNTYFIEICDFNVALVSQFKQINKLS